MKELEGDEKGAKLEVLKDLLKMSKSSMKDKLPKGKGIAMMSVSVSKPKMEPKTTEELEQEAPETEAEDKEMPEMSELDAEEAPEEEEAEEEEEDMEHEFSEPKIPADIMEIVKMMLAKKGK